MTGVPIQIKKKLIKVLNSMTPISFIALMLLANFLATSAERPGERSWVGEHFYGDDGTTGYKLNEQGLCVKKGGKQKGQEIYEEVVG